MAKKENRHAELVSASVNIEAPYELPEGWNWEKLGNLFSHTTGKALNKENTVGALKKYITTSNLYWNTFDFSDVREMYFTEDELEKCTATKGDLLICNGGDVGRAAIWNFDYDICIQNHISKLRKKSDFVSTEFFYYIFLFYKDLGLLSGKGIGIAALSAKTITNLIIPLPPTLAEQQRIVNRIETMFAKLDQAQEKAQSVLDSFETRKAAILHKAFTGQLKIDNEELKIEDWEEKKLGDIVNGFKYGVSDKCDYKNDGIPVLRIPNVGDGTIDFTDLKYSERSNIEENYIVKENDILIIRSNGSRELVGKSALYNNTDKQFSYGSFLIKITPSEVVNPKYLVTFLNSDDARNQMFNKAKSSSGIHNINTKELSEIKLKLPPLNYQLSIVNFLDSVLEKESRAKEAAQTVLDQIALLKKSILARAFRGEL